MFSMGFSHSFVQWPYNRSHKLIRVYGPYVANYLPKLIQKYISSSFRSLPQLRSMIDRSSIHKRVGKRVQRQKPQLTKNPPKKHLEYLQDFCENVLSTVEANLEFLEGSNPITSDRKLTQHFIKRTS